MLSLCNVNIWALLVTSVAALVVSTLWYSDYVLGKQWRAYMGNLFTTQPSTKAMVKMYVGQFILSLITNFILARAIYYTDTSTAVRGLVVSVVIWLGFVATVEASAIVWEKKSWKLVAINAGAYLVAFIVSGIIFAVWR